jgi:F0F1-type ATP synthase membrane subunit a
MFHVVSLCFMLQAYVFSVLGVLHVCFKCFIRMLQKYLDAT